MSNINNKALSIQVSLNGLSFCIKDIFTNKISYLKSIPFERSETPYKVKDYLLTELDKQIYSSSTFNDVVIIHRNELSTFVPQEFFDENHLADYLKFNAKILQSDLLSYDKVETNRSFNVYVPWVNINNAIIDRFGEFIYKHSSTVLVENLLLQPSEPNSPRVYINLDFNHFEMVVVENSSLLFYNMFEFMTPEDISYYVLFTMEQLNLSVEKTALRFLGGVNRDDENFEITYRYVRDVDIFEPQNRINFAQDIDLSQQNTHFILLNSFN